MQLFIFPEKDSTIYSDLPNNNFGNDEILEIIKTSNKKFNFGNSYFCKSRILIKFNLFEISNLLLSGSIIPEYYLNLYVCRIFGQTYDSNLFNICPIINDWIEGTGKRLSELYKIDGVSWNKSTATTPWSNAGGDYINSLINFSIWDNIYSNFEKIKINVTNIVNDWLSNTYSNNGFIIKRTDEYENNSEDYGAIQFYSRHTNTIFKPKLEIVWDDSIYNYTGSFINFDLNNIFISLLNLKDVYYNTEIATIDLDVRKKFSVKTISNIFPFEEKIVLPPTSYYSVYDVLTGEDIISFDENFSKISYSNNKHYFKLNMKNFYKNRFYKIKVKIIYNDNETIFNLPESFKII